MEGSKQQASSGADCKLEGEKASESKQASEQAVFALVRAEFFAGHSVGGVSIDYIPGNPLLREKEQYSLVGG